MTLPDLLSALDRQAAEELAAAQRAAGQEAAVLRAAATAEAERLLAEAVVRAEVQARREAARRVAAARSAAAQDVRLVREQALQQVHDAALQALDQVRQRPDAAGLLAACLTAAKSRVPAADGVRVDPRDAERIRRLVGDAPLQVTPDLQTRGGVVVHGGGRYADCTFETRLIGAWPVLRGQLSAGWEVAG